MRDIRTLLLVLSLPASPAVLPDIGVYTSSTMPILFISSSSDDHTRARWWLSPTSFRSVDPASSLLLMSLPAASPLLFAAPLLLAGGSPLAVCSALISAPARPSSPPHQSSASSSSSSATSSPTSSLSSSPPVHSSPASPSTPSPPAPPPHAAAKARQSNMFVAGLVSGLVVAGLFNPWDRSATLHSRHTPYATCPHRPAQPSLPHSSLSSSVCANVCRLAVVVRLCV